MSTPPAPRTTIVNEAITTPKPQFRDAAGMLQVIASFTEQCQDLENVINDVWLSFTIENGEGFSLDIVGKWLGVPRQSLSDPNYKALLRATVRARRSFGRIEDFYAVAALFEDRVYAVFGGDVFGTYVEIRGLWGTFDINIFLDLMNKTRQAAGELSISYQNFEDTDALQFASGDVMEYDTDSGFANDAGTEGGYFSEYIR